MSPWTSYAPKRLPAERSGTDLNDWCEAVLRSSFEEPVNATATVRPTRALRVAQGGSARVRNREACVGRWGKGARQQQGDPQTSESGDGNDDHRRDVGAVAGAEVGDEDRAGDRGAEG